MRFRMMLKADSDAIAGDHTVSLWCERRLRIGSGSQCEFQLPDLPQVVCTVGPSTAGQMRLMRDAPGVTIEVGGREVPEGGAAAHFDRHARCIAAFPHLAGSTGRVDRIRDSGPAAG